MDYCGPKATTKRSNVELDCYLILNLRQLTPWSELILSDSERCDIKRKERYELDLFHATQLQPHIFDTLPDEDANKVLGSLFKTEKEDTERDVSLGGFPFKTVTWNLTCRQPSLTIDLEPRMSHSAYREHWTNEDYVENADEEIKNFEDLKSAAVESADEEQFIKIHVAQMSFFDDYFGSFVKSP